MPEVEAIPLIANVLGLNRDVAKHRLSERESPDSIDVEYAGDVSGIIGPRGGRSRALYGGGTLRGVMPFNFPWGPYRVQAYDDTFSGSPVTWPTPTFPSLPAIPVLGNLWCFTGHTPQVVAAGGGGPPYQVTAVTPWGTCNSSNTTVTDPWGGTIVWNASIGSGDYLNLTNLGAGYYTFTTNRPGGFSASPVLFTDPAKTVVTTQDGVVVTTLNFAGLTSVIVTVRLG